MTQLNKTLWNRRIRPVVVLALGAVALTAAACGSSPSSANPTTTPPATAPGTTGSATAPSSTGTPSTSSTTPAASTSLKAALDKAYGLETGALATYRNVTATFGQVGPFPNVITSEIQHVRIVTTLLTSYGLAVPAASAGTSAPATFTLACGLGVTTEKNLVSSYDHELIPTVSSYPTVERALENLKQASEDNHLPAFEHCS